MQCTQVCYLQFTAANFLTKIAPLWNKMCFFICIVLQYICFGGNPIWMHCNPRFKLSYSVSKSMIEEAVEDWVCNRRPNYFSKSHRFTWKSAYSFISTSKSRIQNFRKIGPKLKLQQFYPAWLESHQIWRASYVRLI